MLCLVYGLTVFLLLFPLCARNKDEPRPASGGHPPPLVRILNYLDQVQKSCLVRPEALLADPEPGQGIQCQDIQFLNELFLQAILEGQCLSEALSAVRSRVTQSVRAFEASRRMCHMIRFRSICILLLLLAGRFTLEYTGWFGDQLMKDRLIHTLPTLAGVVCLSWLAEHYLIRFRPDPWFYKQQLTDQAKQYCTLLLLKRPLKLDGNSSCPFELLSDLHRINGTDHEKDLLSLLNSHRMDLDEHTAFQIKQWEEWLPIAEFIFLLLCSAILTGPILPAIFALSAQPVGETPF